MTFQTAAAIGVATVGLVVAAISNQPPPKAEATVAKPQCTAAESGKCECFDKGGCKCVAGKQCAPKVEAMPLPHGPAVIVKIPKPEPVAAKVAPRHRYLTSEEILVIYGTHMRTIEPWILATDPNAEESLRTSVERWLAENPKHDPRSPEYVAVPIPELPPPTSGPVIDEHPVSKAAPLYTQPQPAAKPQAVTAPRQYRYVYTRQSSCANGQCGSGSRPRLLGRWRR